MDAIRAILRVCVLALLVATASCGLFETRDPQAPEPPVQNCRPLTSSAAATLNVEDSYGRNALRTCYASMIDTSFLFHPDPQDSLQNPDPFAGWDDQVEIVHNSQIASLQTFLEVDFTGEYDDPIISQDQSTEIRFYDYVLRVGGLEEGDTTIARYTGKADITFRRTNGQWKMIDWADHRGTVSDSTWGLLRSNHR